MLTQKEIRLLDIGFHFTLLVVDRFRLLFCRIFLGSWPEVNR